MFDWGEGITFGSSYFDVRKNEGLRSWVSTVLKFSMILRPEEINKGNFNINKVIHSLCLCSLSLTTQLNFNMLRKVDWLHLCFVVYNNLFYIYMASSVSRQDKLTLALWLATAREYPLCPRRRISFNPLLTKFV